VCVTLCLAALQVRNGETPDEATAVFQYTVYDKRKPLVDDQNNKMRKVRLIQRRSTCWPARMYTVCAPGAISNQ
jgi:hypothetical protein